MMNTLQTELFERNQNNLFKKLVDIRKSIDYLQKTEEGNQGARYVNPSILVHKIKTGLDEKNILLFQCLEKSTVEIISDATKNNPDAKSWLFSASTNFTFIDAETGATIKIPWFITGKHKNDPAMAGGSALTYFERYFLLKFFLIPTSKDDPEFFEAKTSEKVSKEQIEEFKKIITEKGYINSTAVLSKYAVKIENLLKIEDLPASKFESAKKFFDELYMKEFKGVKNEKDMS